jgi:hypothetical protein
MPAQARRDRVDLVLKENAFLLTSALVAGIPPPRGTTPRLCENPPVIEAAR